MFGGIPGGQNADENSRWPRVAWMGDGSCWLVTKSLSFDLRKWSDCLHGCAWKTLQRKSMCIWRRNLCFGFFATEVSVPVETRMLDDKGWSRPWHCGGWFTRSPEEQSSEENFRTLGCNYVDWNGSWTLGSSAWNADSTQTIQTSWTTSTSSTWCWWWSWTRTWPWWGSGDQICGRTSKWRQRRSRWTSTSSTRTSSSGHQTTWNFWCRIWRNDCRSSETRPWTRSHTSYGLKTACGRPWRSQKTYRKTTLYTDQVCKVWPHGDGWAEGQALAYKWHV